MKKLAICFFLVLVCICVESKDKVLKYKIEKADTVFINLENGNIIRFKDCKSEDEFFENKKQGMLFIEAPVNDIGLMVKKKDNDGVKLIKTGNFKKTKKVSSDGNWDDELDKTPFKKTKTVLFAIKWGTKFYLCKYEIKDNNIEVAIKSIAVSKEKDKKTTSPANGQQTDFPGFIQRNGIVYRKSENKPFTGLALKTYKDGRIAVKQFKNGKGNGLSILWHTKNKKAMQVTLVDNKPHGLLIKWNKEGNIIRKEKWEKGKLIKSIIPNNKANTPIPE